MRWRIARRPSPKTSASCYVLFSDTTRRLSATLRMFRAALLHFFFNFGGDLTAGLFDFSWNVAYFAAQPRQGILNSLLGSLDRLFPDGVLQMVRALAGQLHLCADFVLELRDVLGRLLDFIANHFLQKRHLLGSLLHLAVHGALKVSYLLRGVPDLLLDVTVGLLG